MVDKAVLGNTEGDVEVTDEDRARAREFDGGDDDDKKEDAGQEDGTDDADDPTDDEIDAITGEDDRRVPYGRLAKVAAEREQERDARIVAETRAQLLEQQLAAAKPKEPPKPAVDLKALRVKRNIATHEGDTEAAAEIDGEIDAELARIAKAERAAEREEDRATIRRENAAADLRKTAARVFRAHPELNPKSDTFDTDVAGDVMIFRNAFIDNGESPADALEAAVEKVLGKAKKGKAEEEDDTDLTPDQKRKRAAIARGAETELKQPPRTAGSGNRGTKNPESIDVAKMTDAEFAKLTKEEKSRLRGDVV